MRLGSLNLENRYILAPMLNITTAPYRRFCRTFHSIGLVSVPMLYTKRIEKNPKSIEKDLIKVEEERPISVQLIGSDPEALKKTIDYLESYKFDVLDLNAGCPSKRAIKAKEGGYLMKDFENLKTLIQTAVKYSARPISLKIRTGFDKPFNIKEMAKIINNSGIDFLIIHARLVKSNFSEGNLDLGTVKKLKESLTIPLIGNGDIDSTKSAKHFIDYTKVDALMVGRESMGNPIIFKELHEYFTKGKDIPLNRNINQIKEFIRIFEEKINEFLDGISHPLGNEEIKFIELKRNAIWLMKDIEKSKIIRHQLNKAKSIKQIKTIVAQA
ncbi:MAG: tRNA dihydrouridine synthase [Candidatus Hodarchaeota archaeon]